MENRFQKVEAGLSDRDSSVRLGDSYFIVVMMCWKFVKCHTCDGVVKAFSLDGSCE